MTRKLAFVVGYAVILVSSTLTLVAAADFGTPEEAKMCTEGWFLRGMGMTSAAWSHAHRLRNPQRPQQSVVP